MNDALNYVKMRCEGIEERFSNNRVIVRPLSWLVCIGPFQPPNKGGLPLLRSRKSFLYFQFFLQTRVGGAPTTEIQEILSPLSVFSPNKGGTPTTEIRKAPFRISQANFGDVLYKREWWILEPIKYSRALDQLQSRDLLYQRVKMNGFRGANHAVSWVAGWKFVWMKRSSRVPGLLQALM